MVSIEDDAIPDADNLGDPDRDPFFGTRFDQTFNTLDPSPDNPPAGGDQRLAAEADDQRQQQGVTDVDPVGPDQPDTSSDGNDTGLLVGGVGLLVGLLVAASAVLGGD